MKKHIFGAALFSLIVASFAFVYAFFYAPSIPPKEAVRPPLSQTEVPAEKSTSYCNLKRNNVSYAIQSSEFYVSEGRLVSTLKVKWNGSEAAPKYVFVQSRIFDINQPNNVSFIKSDNFRSNFNDLNVATVTVNQDFYGLKDIKKAKNNLYVVFDVVDQYSKENSLFDPGKLTEAKPVLSIYGDFSPKVEVTEVPVVRGVRDISQ